MLLTYIHSAALHYLLLLITALIKIHSCFMSFSKPRAMIIRQSFEIDIGKCGMSVGAKVQTLLSSVRLNSTIVHQKVQSGMLTAFRSSTKFIFVQEFLSLKPRVELVGVITKMFYYCMRCRMPLLVSFSPKVGLKGLPDNSNFNSKRHLLTTLCKF